MKINLVKRWAEKDSLWVVLLWLFFQAIWYIKFGARFDLEAGKYIFQADYLLEHHDLSETRFLFYFTTTAVIAFSKLIGAGLYGALAMIMLINLSCYLAFFKGLQKLFQNRLAPFLVVGFLLYFWPYQSWSFYLYTECLFYSLVLLLFAHLIRFRQLDVRFVFKLVVLLLLVVASRPLGILFILPALLFVFLKLNKRQRIVAGVAALLALVALNFVVQVVFTTTSDWSMKRALTENSIICDMPRATTNDKLDLSQHPNQLYQLFHFVTHNFSHFAGLALIRLRYFFVMTRSYYSTLHNLYLLVHLAALYGIILIGIRMLVRTFPPALLLFIGSSVLLFAAAIALQCDDYHNRFALTLTPLYITLAVWVLLPVLRKFRFLK
jgi:hypothetical protein